MDADLAKVPHVCGDTVEWHWRNGNQWRLYHGELYSRGSITYTDRDAHTHTYTDRDTHTYRYADANASSSFANPNSNIYTDINTYGYLHPNADRNIYCYPDSHGSFSDPNSHVHANGYSYGHLYANTDGDVYANTDGDIHSNVYHWSESDSYGHVYAYAYTIRHDPSGDIGHPSFGNYSDLCRYILDDR